MYAIRSYYAAEAAASEDEDDEDLEELEFELDAEFEDKPVAAQEQETAADEDEDEEIDLSDIEQMLEGEGPLAAQAVSTTLDMSDDPGKWIDSAEDLGLDDDDEIA